VEVVAEQAVQDDRLALVVALERARPEAAVEKTVSKRKTI
jgi:hypothetical protein